MQWSKYRYWQIIDASTCSDDVHSVLEDDKDFLDFFPDWKSADLWKQWIEFGKQCFAKGLSPLYMDSFFA